MAGGWQNILTIQAATSLKSKRQVEPGLRSETGIDIK